MPFNLVTSLQIKWLYDCLLGIAINEDDQEYPDEDTLSKKILFCNRTFTPFPVVKATTRVHFDSDPLIPTYVPYRKGKLLQFPSDINYSRKILDPQTQTRFPCLKCSCQQKTLMMNPFACLYPYCK